MGEYTAKDRERDARDVWVAVHDWLELDLTPEQVQEILRDRHVGGLIMMCGVDTESREKIADYLARKITGRRWPTDEDPGFNDTFLATAEAQGYKKRAP